MKLTGMTAKVSGARGVGCITLTRGRIHFANPFAVTQALHEQTILPPRYRTTNWSTTTNRFGSGGSLLIWVDKENDLARRRVTAGRTVPPVFSDAAIQFLSVKSSTVQAPLRQTAGMVASLLSWRGWTGPCRLFHPVRRQKDLGSSDPPIACA